MLKDHLPSLSTRERKLIDLYFGERILKLPSTAVILKNETLFHGGILCHDLKNKYWYAMEKRELNDPHFFFRI